jgi:hypothetical protein
MKGVFFYESDVTGADFSEADLSGASVSQAKGWKDAICSDATQMPPGWVCDEGAPVPDVVIPE